MALVALPRGLLSAFLVIACVIACRRDRDGIRAAIEDQTSADQLSGKPLLTPYADNESRIMSRGPNDAEHSVASSGPSDSYSAIIHGTDGLLASWLEQTPTLFFPRVMSAGLATLCVMPSRMHPRIFKASRLVVSLLFGARADAFVLPDEGEPVSVEEADSQRRLQAGCDDSCDNGCDGSCDTGCDACSMGGLVCNPSFASCDASCDSSCDNSCDGSCDDYPPPPPSAPPNAAQASPPPSSPPPSSPPRSPPPSPSAPFLTGAPSSPPSSPPAPSSPPSPPSRLPSPSPPPDPPSPRSPSSPPFPPPPSPSSSKLTISFTAAGTVTDFPKDSVRGAFAAKAKVAASQVLVTVTAGSVVVAVEIAADASLAPAAAAAWADDLNTALAPSLSDASSLDSFLASKGVTSVTTESAPTVVVVKPSPMPPPGPLPPPPQPPPCSPFTMSANLAVSGSNMQIGESNKFHYADRCECEVACAGESGCLGFVDDHDDNYCKFKTSTVTSSNTNKDFWARDSSCTTPPTCTLSSLPPPSSVPTNATQLGVIEWTDHGAFWAACLVIALIIVACGVCACCSPYSPCFVRSKAGEADVLKETAEDVLKEVYESLPDLWKDDGWQKKLCKDTTEYFKLVKLEGAKIVNDDNEPQHPAANKLLRGVELRHVLKSSRDENPLSMRMENEKMFKLSSPQTQLFAFLSHVRAHTAAASAPLVLGTAGAFTCIH